MTAEDGTTSQDWTVTVSEASAGLSDETDILSFSIPEQSRDALIDGDNHRITVEVANGTDLANLTPVWTLSPGASSVPESGVVGDYSSNVTISVTAEDGTTVQDWIVEVYIQEDYQPMLFCDRNLCATNEDRAQDCIDYITECLTNTSTADDDECVITAISMCKY